MLLRLGIRTKGLFGSVFIKCVELCHVNYAISEEPSNPVYDLTLARLPVAT